MQNRYFGDVGDFGKYGLLSILCGVNGEEMLRLGIIWYLYPDETHNQDGKHIHYLQRNDRAFRDCDDQLYDGLRHLLIDDLGQLIQANRCTSAIEKSGLLPESTLYYNRPLFYPDELSVQARFSLRNKWFGNALAETASTDFVFLDPDNGIECTSVKRTAKKGPKYVFWDDLTAFAERRQSIVVYHHLNRSGPHSKQVEDMCGQMRERFLPKGFEISAVTFTRGTSRAYFIIASSQHRDLLRQRLEKIRSGFWRRHFK